MQLFILFIVVVAIATVVASLYATVVQPDPVADYGVLCTHCGTLDCVYCDKWMEDNFTLALEQVLLTKDTVHTETETTDKHTKRKIKLISYTGEDIFEPLVTCHSRKRCDKRVSKVRDLAYYEARSAKYN